MAVKVAILGGGVGGITTAFALTSTPELRSRFDVTVYQRGWRIGGKGASGRNAQASQRIEEHGLHIWFGFYDNAFRLMRECYEELDRPHDHPLATLHDAFHPCDVTVLYDRWNDGWYPWVACSPRNLIPVGKDAPLPDFWVVLDLALLWIAEQSAEHAELRGATVAHHDPPAWVAKLAVDVEVVASGTAKVIDHIIAIVHRLIDGDRPDRHPLLCALLDHMRNWLWDAIVARHVDNNALRIYFTCVDMLTSAAIGVLKDDLLDRGLSAIDDEEFRDWLKRHGALDITIGADPLLDAPVVRVAYDLAFSFESGDTAQPTVAAGVALRSLIRLGATYHTALYFKMQAGMGDTVFGPYYEVLRGRGVKFEFFHWVTDLQTNGTEITGIEVVPQVAVRDEAYDPLVGVNGLDCWPSEPRWLQLVGGERLRGLDIDFEAEANPLRRTPRVLQRGADFDIAVLAIPVGALPAITKSLQAANPRFAKMLESSRTCMTQAFQLWVTDDTADLGWPTGNASISGTYVEPLDTYSDMSQLLPREQWPPELAPKSIAYFCGVLADRPGESEAEATARAKAAALDYLQHSIGGPWPKAVDENGALNWNLLVDPEERVGAARFDAQYWRANADTSERYVQAPPKLVRDRLAADESGFTNLFLAGDWTRNGLDAGCVEAATMSGLQAARAIRGDALAIMGEDDAWL